MNPSITVLTVYLSYSKIPDCLNKLKFQKRPTVFLNFFTIPMTSINTNRFYTFGAISLLYVENLSTICN